LFYVFLYLVNSLLVSKVSFFISARARMLL